MGSGWAVARFTTALFEGFAAQPTRLCVGVTNSLYVYCRCVCIQWHTGVAMHATNPLTNKSKARPRVCVLCMKEAPLCADKAVGQPNQTQAAYLARQPCSHAPGGWLSRLYFTPLHENRSHIRRSAPCRVRGCGGGHSCIRSGTVRGGATLRVII